jgi:hypothetical protein
VKDEAAASASRAKAAANAAAQLSEADTTPAPAQTARHQTHQPWKGTTTPGFVQRTRTPRKVGGS